MAAGWVSAATSATQAASRACVVPPALSLGGGESSVSWRVVSALIASVLQRRVWWPNPQIGQRLSATLAAERWPVDVRMLDLVVNLVTKSRRGALPDPLPSLQVLARGALRIPVRGRSARWPGAVTTVGAMATSRRNGLEGRCPARLPSGLAVTSIQHPGARSSTDRASDYGSEGWGFESLRARSLRQRRHQPSTCADAVAGCFRLRRVALASLRKISGWRPPVPTSSPMEGRGKVWLSRRPRCGC